MSAKRTSDQMSLTGRRVLVTRAAEQASSLADALAKCGAVPVVVPTIAIVPPPSFAELDRALAGLDHIDYLLLTSVNAVEAVFDRLAVLGCDACSLSNLKTVAVGPKSAAALAAHGIAADLVPEDYRAEGLVALLKNRVNGKRLLYPKAALARDLIPDELSAAGAEVIDPVAYASSVPDDAADRLQNALADGLDLLTFTASSTVKNLVALLDTRGLAMARKIPVASIGPLTSATARGLGFSIVIEAQHATLDALVEAIKDYYAKS